MAARTLPGMGLQGFETLGAPNWNTFVDSNWRIVSAWLQARVKSVVAAVPTVGVTDGDTHLITAAPNANALAIRDNGSWVYLMPMNGHRVYDEATGLTFVFNGSSWAPEFADLSASPSAPAMVLRKRGSSAGVNAPVANGGQIGAYQLQGWTGSAWRAGAQIFAQAQQLWSEIANGTQLVFQTVGNGSTSLVDRARLSHAEMWIDVPITGLAAQKLALFCAYSGTPNTISLTYGQSSMAVGQQVRFRATNPNTGATTINLDGMGPVACRTVTGASLPSGYIRTGVDTVATYDGTFWIIERLVEHGSNSNGSWVKYADGKQECWHAGFADTTTESVGGIFRSVSESSWTFPVPFLTVDGIAILVNAKSADRWAHARPSSNTGALIRQFGVSNSSTSVEVNARAVGAWY